MSIRQSALYSLVALFVLFAVQRENCAAQDSPPPRTPQDISVAATPAGVRRHIAGRWALVAVNGSNRSDTDAEQTLVVTVGENPTLQFARRIWIPARSRRQTFLPIRIPDNLLPSDVHVPMSFMRMKSSSDGETFEANFSGLPKVERTLLLSWESSVVALFLEQASVHDRESIDRVERLTDAIDIAREAGNSSDEGMGLIRLSSNFLPPTPRGLDALDQIVIAGDRILNDSTAVSRLRSWLQAGGRMWIMLDQVSPEKVRRLLADATCYSEVDRIELNQHQLKETLAHATATELVAEDWASDRPADLVRVFTESEDIQSRIDGWPAAFWTPVGQGEVLFTTLSTHGWMQKEAPLRSFGAIASRFFVSRDRPRSNTEEIAAVLQADIGYKIPRRNMIAIVLGTHIALILLCSIWCLKRRSLHQMALVVPVTSILAAGCLLVMGKQHTGAVPSTIATGQIAHVSADSAQVQVESVSAIYSQQERPLRIDSSPGTTAMLGEADLGGDLKRILWTDDGRNQWQFVRQAPGVVRNVECESTVSLPQPWSVKGRFTAEGFQAEVDGLSQEKIEDPLVIAGPAPSLSMKPLGNSSATFRGGIADIMSTDQFIDDTLMSDLQHNRQDLLRRLVANDPPVFGRDPIFVVWTDAIDSGVSFDDDYEKHGWALAAIPIKYVRLPSGSDFQLPSSFARVKALGGISSVFNSTTGQWLQGMNKAIETELQVVVPPALLPCDVSRADVAIKLNAPSRTLEIRALIDGKYKTVFTRRDPSGLLQFQIDQPEALKLDAEGGLRLQVAVSGSLDETSKPKTKVINADAESGQRPGVAADPNRNTWHVEYLHVSLVGTMK